MAVLNGKYSFPTSEGSYSEGLKEIVKECLRVKPNERPEIDQVNFSLSLSLSSIVVKTS